MIDREPENRTAPGDPLSVLLRKGDPASDGRDLDPLEVARLRERMLAAAGDSQLAGACWWRPALAAAGAGILAAVVAMALFLSNRPRTGPSAEGSVNATRHDFATQGTTARRVDPRTLNVRSPEAPSSHETAPDRIAARTVIPKSTPKDERSARFLASPMRQSPVPKRPTRESQSPAESAPARIASLPQEVATIELPEARAPIGAGDPAVPVANSRQLQFSTPGGTRIVWVLDPDYLSSHSASRQSEPTEL